MHRHYVAFMPNENRITTTVRLDPELLDRLRALNARTRVPISVYIREGIEAVLNKEERKLEKS